MAGRNRGAGAPQTARRARGFVPARALIGAQMATVGARRGFARARLAALWPEIVGADLAAVTRPERLVLTRGPAGGLLAVAVAGAHAARVQMMLPTLILRVNAALGPGAVGRVQLVHGPIPAAPRAPAPPATRRQPAAGLGALEPALAGIRDDALRSALATLARNVLSRRPRTP
jgi:hypothetical protein